ncbi:MAG: hypothetical protein JXB29_01905 [Sedimentisphaerales bacterium]|nr:hypothetical protein [Sedimentisphaerales bacterium]
MKKSMHNLIKVFATGFIVLVLFSLPLFWARWFCKVSFDSIVNKLHIETVYMKPSGFLPPELESDPNIVRQSVVMARIQSDWLTRILGVNEYVQQRQVGEEFCDVYFYLDDSDQWSYFDRNSGLIVCQFINKESFKDKTVFRGNVKLFIGPDGISETPDESLGRFLSPVGAVAEETWPSLIVYDKKLRRFYRIDLEEMKVFKGPEILQDSQFQLVQVGKLIKGPDSVYIDWHTPERKGSGEEAKGKSTRFKQYQDGYLIPIVHQDAVNTAGRYILVLDNSGQIHLLNRRTLEISGKAGYLPAPRTLFPSNKSVTAKDLLAYRVLPVAFDGKYAGMCVAAVSREGTAMALAVFNEKGELVKREDTIWSKYIGAQNEDYNIYSSEAVCFNTPWGPTKTIFKYLLENLHPPILSLASYFGASAFEARSGHRALFVLPDSFIAMKGRQIDKRSIDTFGAALIFMLPSIILAALLACRVNKDALIVGLSKNTRTYWLIGTFCFGLIAYITYRCTRPKTALVTCRNCGKLRRPDMDKCHRCGSDWEVLELQPPDWLVCDTR